MKWTQAYIIEISINELTFVAILLRDDCTSSTTLFSKPARFRYGVRLSDESLHMPDAYGQPYRLPNLPGCLSAQFPVTVTTGVWHRRKSTLRRYNHRHHHEFVDVIVQIAAQNRWLHSRWRRISDEDLSCWAKMKVNCLSATPTNIVAVSLLDTSAASNYKK